MHPRLNHFHQPGCGCDPKQFGKETLKHFERYRKEPSQCLRRACGLDDGPMDIDLFTAVIIHVVPDKNLRTLAVVEGLLHVLFNGWRYPMDPTVLTPLNKGTWRDPLFGIARALEIIVVSKERGMPLGKEDHLIEKRICDVALKILEDIVYKDLEYLTLPFVDAVYVDHKESSYCSFNRCIKHI